MGISAGGPGQNSAEVSELIAPIPVTHGSNSLGNSSFTPQIAPAEAENLVDYDEVYYDDDTYFDDPMPSSMEKGINEVQTDDDSNCSHDNDSEEEVPDESDDDGYNRYDGYDEWGNCDRGYYYRDRRRERKTSPMMSPIISPISCKRHPYIPPQ
ncbi:hypothetical protein RhiirA5_367758 [Rhizophagus irregularis]|uniref:Uncharacterized protein n=2 Tax=Rhizophagus irregularis TaxID=588596 RepID=A0A2N0NPB1_9GLOM|nr:hypothetical protein RhiirA5_367758 [Rhizophagus irregularis]